MSKMAENVYNFNWVCKLCFFKIFGLNMTTIVFNRNGVNTTLNNIVVFSFDLISNESIGTIYGAIFYIKQKPSEIQLGFTIFLRSSLFDFKNNIKLINGVI